MSNHDHRTDPAFLPSPRRARIPLVQRHILLWSIALLYLLLAPSLHYHLFARQGKPIEIWKKPPDVTGGIVYAIGKTLTYWSENGFVYDVSETHLLSGWAFVNLGPDTQQAHFDRFIVLHNKSQAYMFPVQNHSVPRVQRVFRDTGLKDLAASGFTSVISRNALPPGEYFIGILFKHRQNGSTYYIQSNKLIERTPNNLLLKTKT